MHSRETDAKWWYFFLINEKKEKAGEENEMIDLIRSYFLIFAHLFSILFSLLTHTSLFCHTKYTRTHTSI